MPRTCHLSTAAIDPWLHRETNDRRIPPHFNYRRETKERKQPRDPKERNPGRFSNTEYMGMGKSMDPDPASLNV